MNTMPTSTTASGHHDRAVRSRDPPVRGTRISPRAETQSRRRHLSSHQRRIPGRWAMDCRISMSTPRPTVTKNAATYAAPWARASRRVHP